MLELFFDISEFSEELFEMVFGFGVIFAMFMGKRVKFWPVCIDIFWFLIAFNNFDKFICEAVKSFIWYFFAVFSHVFVICAVENIFFSEDVSFFFRFRLM